MKTKRQEADSTRPNSGRSFSSFNPQGKRAKRQGRELAPKSLRAKGKTFVEDCTSEELEKALQA